VLVRLYPANAKVVLTPPTLLPMVPDQGL